MLKIHYFVTCCKLIFMRKILLTALLAISAAGVYAQGADAVKAYMEYATPGEMHKMLGKYNGNWTAVTKMWMSPGMEPSTSFADVTNDMYYGDRYQKSIFNGDMQGTPFQGESVTGYDNIKKVFTNTWIDNYATGVMYSEGKWDAATKSVEFKGKASDPMTQSATPFRQVMTFPDENNYSMVMYVMMQGKEYKSMEITFTRKK